MASLKYWIWLTTRRGLGLQGTLRLLDAFGDPARVYFADPAEYRQFSQAAQASLLDKSLDRVEEIFSIIIPKGIGIECNTNRGNDPLPDADILRFYRQMGGEIITLGSDAHEVKDVGCVIKERQELLKDCGFQYFTTFIGGEPAFQKL